MTTRICDLSFEELYDQVVYLEREHIATEGRVMKVDHLKTENGKRLNGKACHRSGFDRDEHARLNCHLITAGKKRSPTPIGVKRRNPVPRSSAKRYKASCLPPRQWPMTP